jgi:hypothetical protein
MTQVLANGSWNRLSSADGFGLVGGADFKTTAGVSVPVLIHPTLPRVLEVEVFSSETDLIAGEKQTLKPTIALVGLMETTIQ